MVKCYDQQGFLAACTPLPAATSTNGADTPGATDTLAGGIFTNLDGKIIATSTSTAGAPKETNWHRALLHGVIVGALGLL